MPKVDSAIIRLTPIPPRPGIDPEKFFAIARAGFSSPRKQLMNNLRSYRERKDREEVFGSFGMALTIRPEQVSLEQWLALSERLP